MARLGKLTRFASAQVLVQALGFAAGLLILRSVSQSEYGHYTLVLTMIGLATALLDLGLMTAVGAAGGPWHSNPGQLRCVMADADRLQRRLAWLALLLLPAFMFMLMHQGLSAASAAVFSPRRGVSPVQASFEIARHKAPSPEFIAPREDW
jgi:hypothetical protein